MDNNEIQTFEQLFGFTEDQTQVDHSVGSSEASYQDNLDLHLQESDDDDEIDSTFVSDEVPRCRGNIHAGLNFPQKTEESMQERRDVSTCKRLLRSQTQRPIAPKQQVIRATRSSQFSPRRGQKKNKLSKVKAAEDGHSRSKETNKTLCFSKMAFARLVREVTQELNAEKTFKFQAAAFEALQMGCEAFLAIVLDSASLMASHSGRSTILQKDIKILEKITGNFLAISNSD